MYLMTLNRLNWETTNYLLGINGKVIPIVIFEVEPSLSFNILKVIKRSTTDLNLKMRFYNFDDYYWARDFLSFLNDQLLEPLNIGPMLGLKKK